MMDVSRGRGDILVTPSGRMVDSLLERALEMGHRFGAAPESHALAKIVASLATDDALPTWDADLQGHSVADTEPGHLRPDGDNSA